ncbi:MAG: multicopper oxidase domain-containing protein [Desulfobacterales bacterium]|nr:multicopper oxidase domain-containing protein [Desulfobacterales bacterium]
MAGYGTLGITAAIARPFTEPLFANPLQPSTQRREFVPDLDLSLLAGTGQDPIFPGPPTGVWRFSATVHKGDESRVVEPPQGYLGPTIRARQGEKVRIRLVNELPEETIVHWHGLHVPSAMDGHPRDVVGPGQHYTYEFTVANRAGTYWYHPHPHGITGPQVYGGLAGLFLVSDDEERAAGLPDGSFDIPLVIQDRTFDRDNQLVYLSGHPMERMIGFLGDRIFVNGKPDYTLPVSTGAYRLRLLNGSNSRIYKLAWKDGRPLTVIATDGGLLETPVHRRYVFLAPGERIELWADFSSGPVGYETALVSLPFDAGAAGGGGMGRGMMRGRRNPGRLRLPNGAPFSICTIQVNRKMRESRRLPERLSEVPKIRPEEAVNIDRPRRFFLTMRHMQWTINGRTFRMEEVADDEVVRIGTKELWEFDNTGGGMGMMRMMDMPHPMHLHGQQFRVLYRTGVTHEGYVDEGWKDTVLVMPGERVRLLTRFDDYPGLFLYHCHNLEHEDMGMMRNYYIRTS